MHVHYILPLASLIFCTFQKAFANTYGAIGVAEAKHLVDDIRKAVNNLKKQADVVNVEIDKALEMKLRLYDALYHFLEFPEALWLLDNHLQYLETCRSHAGTERDIEIYSFLIRPYKLRKEALINEYTQHQEYIIQNFGRSLNKLAECFDEINADVLQELLAKMPELTTKQNRRCKRLLDLKAKWKKLQCLVSDDNLESEMDVIPYMEELDDFKEYIRLKLHTKRLIKKAIDRKNREVTASSYISEEWTLGKMISELEKEKQHHPSERKMFNAIRKLPLLCNLRIDDLKNLGSEHADLKGFDAVKKLSQQRVKRRVDAVMRQLVEKSRRSTKEANNTGHIKETQDGIAIPTVYGQQNVEGTKENPDEKQEAEKHITQPVEEESEEGIQEPKDEEGGPGRNSVMYVAGRQSEPVITEKPDNRVDHIAEVRQLPAKHTQELAPTEGPPKQQDEKVLPIEASHKVGGLCNEATIANVVEKMPLGLDNLEYIDSNGDDWTVRGGKRPTVLKITEENPVLGRVPLVLRHH